MRQLNGLIVPELGTRWLSEYVLWVILRCQRLFSINRKLQTQMRMTSKSMENRSMSICLLPYGGTSSLTLHTRNPHRHILCSVHQSFIIELCERIENEFPEVYQLAWPGIYRQSPHSHRRVCCGYFSYAFWPPIRHNWEAIYISHQWPVSKRRLEWNVFESVACEISMKICHRHKPPWTFQLSYLQWKFVGFIFSCSRRLQLSRLLLYAKSLPNCSFSAVNVLRPAPKVRENKKRIENVPFSVCSAGAKLILIHTEARQVCVCVRRSHAVSFHNNYAPAFPSAGRFAPNSNCVWAAAACFAMFFGCSTRGCVR